MANTQGSVGQLEVFSDFLGPDNDLTWGTGTVHVDGFGFVSVNEGSFEWTVDEPGGILAVTTDTGDNDNAALMAGTFQPADGAIAIEARFKINGVGHAAYVGFTETLALGTPVMPAEFSSTTMTYNGSGGMVGLQWDADGSTDDWRAIAGDGGSASSAADSNGTAASAAVTADSWQLARVEIDQDGKGRCYVGNANVNFNGKYKLVKEFTSAVITPGDNFYGVLMVENRSGAAQVLEVDYIKVTGSRDWSDS